ncbi:hypothetical protein JTB14_037701 [Gonioctena quinquepunctata]|nr:hypothetical protein JTB14_037701 [Gonioctena quinquepunctata]
MDEDDRNISPDMGVKDKPPERTADDSLHMREVVQVIIAQASKDESGKTEVKFRLGNSSKLNSEMKDTDPTEIDYPPPGPDTPDTFRYRNASHFQEEKDGQP